ncbi:MAG: hypothetical protein ACI8XG_002214, partial [Congregibacter sp.]
KFINCICNPLLVSKSLCDHDVTRAFLIKKSKIISFLIMIDEYSDSKRFL